GDDAWIHRLRIKTVDEIDVTAIRHAAEQRAVRLHDFKLVPADLRNFQPMLFRKPDDAAFENSQPGGAGIKLLAPLKQRLVTDADAEERSAGLDERARRFEQFLFAQGVDAIV